METILLVEHEAEIADMTREALTEKGYQILSALNADEAVRLAAAHSGPIHLLLTEFVMPGTSGQDLARQLGVQRPEMKILYMLAFTLSRQRAAALLSRRVGVGARRTDHSEAVHQRAPHRESAGRARPKADIAC